ncbi:unnamed protein product [Rotaria socialis]|uniref:Uncharacterized protein n=1 Tax=Rotaria socialis TaxID=392032 RepID=A0A821DDN6_9BILA|nr:unnamed protein product [Rotaria socialis]CAF4618986.1 unnamed protein product [Rotaria socialis]
MIRAVQKSKSVYNQEQLSLHALKKVGIIDAQAVNALIGAGDEQVKLISDELFKITDELLKLQRPHGLTPIIVIK